MLTFLLISSYFLSSWLVSAQQEGELASFRMLTIGEQEQALGLILNKAESTSYEAYFETDSLETMPAVATMRDLISTPSRHYDFSFGLNRMLLEVFGDAHTRVEVSIEVAGATYLGLDICLSWLFGDKATLVSTCQTDYANIGDIVIELSGFSPTEILGKLQEVIPHENVHFLRELPKSWLIREDFLAYLGILEQGENTTEVSAVFERDGIAQVAVSIPLVANRTSDDINELAAFVSYEIYNESSTAVFTLNACIFNEEFVMMHNEFWMTVKASEDNGTIDKVVLDLRENRGGNFAVAIAFLNNLNMSNSYRLFDIMQRQSEDLCIQSPALCASETLSFLEQLGVDTSSPVYELSDSVLSIFLRQLVGPAPSDKFNGEIFVLTSGATFSSAHLFAAMIQANDVGTLVGEPTGNTPSFWGNLVAFDVPNADLIFLLTTSWNVLPGEKDAIYPDVLVPTTLQDIVQNKDAQLEWVLTHNNTITNAATQSPAVGISNFPTAHSSTIPSSSPSAIYSDLPSNEFPVQQNGGFESETPTFSPTQSPPNTLQPSITPSQESSRARKIASLGVASIIGCMHMLSMMILF